MLVACLAVARLMFRRRDRVWAALVLPAVVVALALTLSRNAWVGACAGIGMLFLLRDFRLVALLPVVLGLLGGVRAGGGHRPALLDRVVEAVVGAGEGAGSTVNRTAIGWR